MPPTSSRERRAATPPSALFALLLLLLPASAFTQTAEGLLPGESIRRTAAAFFNRWAPDPDPSSAPRIGDNGFTIEEPITDTRPRSGPTSQPTGGLLVASIVDARNGTPIAHARWTAIAEDDYPAPPELHRLRTVIADDDGFARIPTDSIVNESGWWIAEADGYAPRMEMGSADEVALWPGIDRPVKVVDGMDRPIANATVGYVMGCGHTGNVREATTGADGIAVLRNLQPMREHGIMDLWVTASGYAYAEGYPSLTGEEREGDGPTIVRMAPRPDIVGRVTDTDGRPLEGYFVGRATVHRGPWTRTDADGRFRLIGLDAESFEVVDPRNPHRPITITRPIDGMERRITWPANPASRDESVDVLVEPFRFDVTVAGSAIPIPSLVAVARKSDGLTLETASASEGAIVTMPLGPCRIRVASATGDFDPVDIERDIAADSAAIARIEVPIVPNPVIRVTSNLAAATDARFVIASASAEYDVTERVIDHRVIPVPRTAACVLRVEGRRFSRVYPVRAAPGGPHIESVTIEPEVGRSIRARFVDSAGRPTTARLLLRSGDLESPFADDDPSIAFATEAVRTVERGGRYFIVAIPEDPHFEAQTFEVVVPEAEGAATDLGVIRFTSSPEPALEIRRADGWPAAAASIVRRDGAFRGVIDEKAHWIGTVKPKAGDVVRINAEDDGMPPCVVTPQGDLPQTIVLPDTRLSLRVTAPEASEMRFDVRCDGREWPPAVGAEPVEVVSLLPGPHRLFIDGGPTRDSVIVEFTLALGAHREISVVMPPPNAKR